MPVIHTSTSQTQPGTVASRIGVRLALGTAAAVLVAVPFTLLTVLVLAKSQGLARVDQNTADRLHTLMLDHPWLTTTMVWVGRITEPWLLRGVAVVVGVLLWRRGARRSAGWLVGTMAVAGLLSVVLKLLVSRTRPAFTDPVTVAGGYSFPSGHALNSMAFAACAVILLSPALAGRSRALLVASAVGFVLLVGFDRVSLGVHYVSDVLAGWTVGLATALATAAAFDRGPVRPLSPRPERGVPPMSSSSPESASEREPGNNEYGTVAAKILGSWVVIFALITGIGLLVTGPLSDVWPFTREDALNRSLAQGRTPDATEWSFWFSALGNTSTIVPLCALFFVTLRVTLQRWREAVFVVVCTIGQSLVFLSTTLVIDRERPDVPKLDESPPTSSFPSGHTSAATALYLALAVVVHRTVRLTWLRRALIVLLALLPLCVLVGRLYRGMHHPSDVTASLLNGALILTTAYRFLLAGHPAPEREIPAAEVATDRVPA